MPVWPLLGISDARLHPILHPYSHPTAPLSTPPPPFPFCSPPPPSSSLPPSPPFSLKCFRVLQEPGFQLSDGARVFSTTTSRDRCQPPLGASSTSLNCTPPHCLSALPFLPFPFSSSCYLLPFLPFPFSPFLSPFSFLPFLLYSPTLSPLSFLPFPFPPSLSPLPLLPFPFSLSLPPFPSRPSRSANPVCLISSTPFLPMTDVSFNGLSGSLPVAISNLTSAAVL
ncbi:unnamed protein product [Closterium sp. Naga37s-1]|nr:unnamed protein product [Closterium sp. Naga37s-1]